MNSSRKSYWLGDEGLWAWDGKEMELIETEGVEPEWYAKGHGFVRVTYDEKTKKITWKFEDLTPGENRMTSTNFEAGDVAAKIRTQLETIKDEGTKIDSGSGMGSSDIWVTIDGVEWYIEIKKSLKQLTKEKSE